MNSMLKELYFGPYSFIPEGIPQELHPFVDKVCVYMEQLEQTQGEVFTENLWQAINELSLQEQTCAFRDGIRFAFQLIDELHTKR